MLNKLESKLSKMRSGYSLLVINKNKDLNQIID